MPLIAPQLKEQREAVTVKLDVRLLTLLKRYAECIASSMDYVVNQALVVTFAKDQDFRRWLQATHPDDTGRLRELTTQQPRPVLPAASGKRTASPSTEPGASAGPQRGVPASGR